MASSAPALLVGLALAACRTPEVVAPAPEVRPAAEPAAPPAPRPAPVAVPEDRIPPPPAWTHLRADGKLAHGELLALRRGQAPEPWGVAVVQWDRVDVYMPSVATPVVSATSEDLGFPINATEEVSPRALAGLIVARAPDRLVALDATNLIMRWEVPIAAGERIKSAWEAGGRVILDRMHPRSAGIAGDQSVTAVDPRDGAVAWRIEGRLGAVDAAGDTVLTSMPALAARDARSGQVRWQRTIDHEGRPAIGPTWVALQEADGMVRALSAADGTDLGRGELGEISSYAGWATFSGGVLAYVFSGRTPRGQERLVAWDPVAGKPAWSTPGHPLFAAGWEEPHYQETRSELLIMDANCGTVRALDRETHAEKWYAGFEGLRGMVLANDGEVALYVQSHHSVHVFTPGAAEPAELVTIRGQVLFDGLPRANAWVRSGDHVVRTDKRGRFVLSTEGRHGVFLQTSVRNAQRPGCAPDDYRNEYVALTGAGTYSVESHLSSGCGD